MEAVFPLVLVAMFIMLVVLPQRRRLRAHQQTLASLAPGDRVITAGGIYGVIVAERGEVLTLSVGPNATLRVARRAIARKAWDDDADTPSLHELGVGDVGRVGDLEGTADHRPDRENGGEPR